MDKDKQVQSVAAQTEIKPETAPNNKKRQLPHVDKRILIVGVIALGLIIILCTFLFIKSKNNTKSGVVLKVKSDAHNFYQKGDYEEAAGVFKAGLNIQNNNPQFQAGLIEMNSLQGNQNGKEDEQLIRSQPYIDQALKTNPDDLDVLVSVGYAYETAGAYNEALKYYNKALAINPNYAPAIFHSGHALQFLGKQNEAYAKYDKAYQLDSSNPLFIMEKANMQSSQGKNQEALKLFNQIASSDQSNNPMKADAYSASAKLSRRLADFNNALEYSKKAYEIDNTYSPALGEYGFNSALTGNTEVGINLLRKSIQANPRITDNYNSLGEVLRASSQYAEAISLFKQAIDKVEDDNTIMPVALKSETKSFYAYNLAKTYYMANDYTNALSTLEQAITLGTNAKKLLTYDYNKGIFFKNLAGDPKFQALLTQ